MMQNEPTNVAVEGILGDEELVRLAQAGDLDAFTGLYERHLPAVYDRVRYVIPEQDVEDVIQEIFIAVMRSLGGFKGDSKFSTWLRTVTNRRVADYYRRRERRGTPVDSDVGEVNPSGAPQLRLAGGLVLEDRVMLREALRAMPDHYREVVLLRFAEGLRFKEIADVRGQSLEATKSLFRRAIKALREEMVEVDA